MSLKRGLTVQFIILISVYTLLNFITHKFIIYPNFLRLEKEEAEKDLHRFKNTFKREIDHLDSTAHDWAAWDDTDRFVKGKNNSYVKTNLGVDTYVTNSVNSIYVVKKDGTVLYGRTYDLKYRRFTSASPLGKSKKWPADHKLLSFDMKKFGIAEATIKGVIQTETGLVMVASRPITTSNHRGKIQGALIMVRLVDDDYMEKLSKLTSTFVNIKRLGEGHSSVIEKKILSEINDGQEIYYKYQADELLDLYTTYNDINGDQILFLIASVSRDISLRGKGTILFGLGSTLFIGIVLFVLLGISLKVAFLSPLRNINNIVSTIVETKNFDKRIVNRKNDEIGAIIKNMNLLLDEVSKERAISDAKSKSDD